MTPQQLTLDVDEPVASVRRSDPRTAKEAARVDPKGRALQKVQMLKRMVQHGPATADDLALVIQRHRSVASTRLNVLRKEGLAEKCGLTPRTDEYGRKRDVELWRATAAGVEYVS